MTQYALTNAGWTQVAAAGASVEVQNLSASGSIVITTSASAPIAGADGEVLSPGAYRKYAEALPNNLYAMAVSLAVSVEVMPIGAAGGGTGGGGAVTVADGADTTQGAKADAAATNSTSSWSVVALLKGLYAALTAPTPAGTNSIGSVLVGTAGSAGDTSVTTGGTAQTLFSGATPTNGFEICNPDAAEDLWISDSTTAAANGQGSYRVGYGGGTYTTPSGYKPAGPVSVLGATTGHKITARKW